MFRMEGSNIEVTSRKNSAGVGLCTLVSAGFFYSRRTCCTNDEVTTYAAGGASAWNAVDVFRQLQRQHSMKLVRRHGVKELFHDAPVQVSRVTCDVEEEQRHLATATKTPVPYAAPIVPLDCAVSPRNDRH